MTAPHPITVPRDSVNDDSVFFVDWVVDEGAWVEAGTIVCSIETSKAIVEIETPVCGFVHQRRKPGDEVPVGGVLGYVSAGPTASLPSHTPEAIDRESGGDDGIVSAKARRKMAELGLARTLFAGMKVVKEKDVIAMAAQVNATASVIAADPRGSSTVTALTPVQRRTAKVMEESAVSIPTAMLEREIDFGVLRASAQQVARTSGVLVTALDLLVLGLARACTRFPVFNGSFEDGYQLRRFATVNVGVAMDFDRELYVAVVPNVAVKSRIDVAKALRGLSYLLQRKCLRAEHLVGGTITITSMIGKGVHRFVPIPLPRQAAIIGVGDPIGDRAALVIVFDHRVANGSEAAAFLSAIEGEAVGD